MNITDIKELITEWQHCVKHEFCCDEKERMEIDAELEKVLLAIDDLVKSNKGKGDL